jgi:hypothetical protein
LTIYNICASINSSNMKHYLTLHMNKLQQLVSSDFMTKVIKNEQDMAYNDIKSAQYTLQMLSHYITTDEIKITTDDNNEVYIFEWNDSIHKGTFLHGLQHPMITEFIQIHEMINIETGTGLSYSILDEEIDDQLEDYDPDCIPFIEDNPTLSNFRISNGHYTAIPDSYAVLVLLYILTTPYGVVII